MQPTDLQMAAQLALAYVAQWARALANVPMWAGHVLIVAVGAGLYWWATPDFVEQLKANWRTAVYGLAIFISATRGLAAYAKDAKLAPSANSK